MLRNQLAIAALLISTLAWSSISRADDKPKASYKIGLIAKSENNPVFQAARAGAEDAVKEYSKKYNCNIELIWRTPAQEDAQKQAQLLEQLVVIGVDGVAISCTDATKTTAAIDKAVAKGVAVATFDSDAPASKRFIFHGVDDMECGRAVLRELAAAIGPAGGKIAVLAG